MARLDEITTRNLALVRERELPPLLPDPEPRAKQVPLVSVDDHFLETGDILTERVPRALVDRVPRIVDEGGTLSWLFEGGYRYPLTVKVTSVVGRHVDDWTHEAVRFEEIRPAAYDVDERVRDLDIAGIDASLCFPSIAFGFCGQRLALMKDAEAGLAAVRAYNDWVIDGWCGRHPTRFIPQQLPWLQDPVVAAEEIRRNAERGFKAVTFSENPEKLGLPSIHTPHWDPFFRACEETETVVDLHVGSSSEILRPSSDGPGEVEAALFPLNAAMAAVDWMYALVPLRFPGIKIVFSESGIGWVPMILERLDRGRTQRGEKTQAWPSDAPMPSEVFRRNFWVTSLEDPAGFALRDRIGVDRIMMECDYPHADTTWPDSQATVLEQLGHLDRDELVKITAGNAASLYRHDVPALTGATASATASATATAAATR